MPDMQRYDSSPLDGIGVMTLRATQGLLSAGRMRSSPYVGQGAEAVIEKMNAVEPDLDAFVGALSSTVVTYLDLMHVSMGALHRMLLLRRAGSDFWNSHRGKFGTQPTWFIQHESKNERQLIAEAHEITGVESIDDAFIMAVVIHRLPTLDASMAEPLLGRISVGRLAYYVALGLGVEQIRHIVDNDIDPELVNSMIGGSSR